MRELPRFSRQYKGRRSSAWSASWFSVARPLFAAYWFPSGFRPHLLRLFGAKVGSNVLIRHNVKIQWPWFLSIGDDCWIGEGSTFIALDRIVIGDDVCISQDAMLCTGSHDHRRSDFAYRNAPIEISDGAWVAARAVVLPGVTIGECSVVAAGEVARRDVPDLHMLIDGRLVALPEPS